MFPKETVPVQETKFRNPLTAAVHLLNGKKNVEIATVFGTA